MSRVISEEFPRPTVAAENQQPAAGLHHPNTLPFHLRTHHNNARSPRRIPVESDADYD